MLTKCSVACSLNGRLGPLENSDKTIRIQSWRNEPAPEERWPEARRPAGLQPQQVWAVRFWLDREGRPRDRTTFALAIDNTLRGCDVVKVKIRDLATDG